MVVGGDGLRRCFIWCRRVFIWCRTVVQLLLQNYVDDCDDDSGYDIGDPGQSNDKGKGKGRYFRDFSDYDPDDTLYDNHWLGKAG